jgi:hypothetical protein
MNFEFKSTFSDTNTFTLWTRVCSFFKSADHAFWISSINILAFVITSSLYLQNYLIPGTYGSGPNGDVWVEGLLLLARVWAATTSYSLLRLVYICNAPLIKKKGSTLHARIKNSLERSQEFIPIIVFQLIMLVNVVLKEPRCSRRYQIAKTINPLTHINFILTV